MNQNYLIIYKGNIESLPPLINVATILKDLNCNVTVVCTEISASNKNLFINKKINIIPVPYKRFHLNNFYKSISKILESKDYNIWIGSPGTGFPLYFLIKKQKYILHCHELYDHRIHHKFVLRLLFKNAYKIVVPSPERSGILRAWYKLRKSPKVLHNKPYLINSEEYVVEKEILNKLEGKKVILYQGGVNLDRNIEPFIKASMKLGTDWKFVIMSPFENNNYFKRLLKKYPIEYVSFINPPFHLAITKLAYIGILTYSFRILNNVFCAPNKIWEYSRFGIPVLTNEVPSLSILTNAYKFGESIDDTNIDSIVESIKKIDADYDYYCKNSLKFYDSINLIEEMKEIIK